MTRCAQQWLAIVMLATMPLSSVAQAPTGGRGQKAILEAVRQDLVRQRLDSLAAGIEGMMRDLQSNAALDSASQGELQRLARQVRDISEGRARRAAEALRQAAADRDNPAHLALAEQQIDQAARDIATIMLHLNVLFATEVFGREMHEAIVKQRRMYEQSLDLAGGWPGTDAGALWRQQDELGDWMSKLIRQLSQVDDYGSDALAMVRLSRVVSELQEAEVEVALHDAAGFIRNANAREAVVHQRSALNAMMVATFRVRPGAELAALVETRDALQAIRHDQSELRQKIARQVDSLKQNGPGSPGAQQALLTRRLSRVLVPPVLPERVQLAEQVLAATGLDNPATEPIPCDELVATALQNMTLASAGITTANAQITTTSQMAAEQSLDRAVLGLQRRIATAMHLDALFQRLQDATRRLKYIRSLEERQQELYEDTQKVQADGNESVYLAMPHDQLATETDAFAKRIEQDNQQSPTPSEFVPLIGRPLARAVGHTRSAVAPLKDNHPGDAMPRQAEAVAALAKAREAAEQEVASLERLWRLLQAVRDLESFAQYLADLEHQQRALREETEATAGGPDATRKLGSSQHLLSLAAAEVGSVLDQGQVDMTSLGQMLTGAGTAMGSAELQLNADKAPDAVPHQRQAEKLLHDAQLEVKRLAEQFNFMAEWLAFLQQLNADALDLLQRQIMLRLETQPAPQSKFGELAGEQDILRAEATTFSQLFPVGQKDYAVAANEMGLAIDALNGGDRKEALRHMALAEDALTSALAQLLAAIQALDQVPMLTLMAEPPEELSTLLRILILASQQRTVRQKTRAASADQVAGRMAEPQEELRAEANDIAMSAGEALPPLRQAEQEMVLARDELRKPKRDPAIPHQQLAEKYLRQLLLEMALAEFALPEELAPAMAMAAPSIIPPMMTVEAEHAFAKSAVEGDLRSGGRTEWRVLGQRDRAALNQNFARELPLEYRDVLRVYFERLSE